MSLADALSRPLYGNAVGAYLAALAVFFGALWGFLLARRLLLSRLRTMAERTATDLDDFAVDVIELVRAPECYLVAIYLGTRGLELPPRFNALLGQVVLVVVSYRVVTMLSAAAVYVSRRLLQAEEGDPARRATANTMAAFLRAFIWVAAVLFVLANMGFDVSSMLAGLGIGGVAVALAAQAVLADLFSALAIFLDKPFEVGDTIAFDGGTGTVERIGLKTTRLRSLSGEQLVVGNAQLTSTRIRNFKRQAERRVVVGFGLSYGAPETALADVPGAVRDIVSRDPLLRFDRAHLCKLGESALEFELVYFVTDADYNKHMDSQQRVLLALVGELRRRGLELAYPTRTVVLQGAKPA